MADSIEISDDEDSFSPSHHPGAEDDASDSATILLCSDKESVEKSSKTLNNLTSDEEEELPEITFTKQRRNVIKKLFPKATTSVDEPDKKSQSYQRKDVIQQLFPKATRAAEAPKLSPPKPKEPGVDKMIGGVSVNLPVQPYGCQIALMSKVITAIKTGQNCLLESPTGSGKTLALLCGALAWQRHERKRIGQMIAENESKRYSELNTYNGAVDYVGSIPDVSFTKTVFGEKSIYDKPTNGDSCSNKRQEPFQDTFQDESETGLVRIQKRRRIYSPESGEASKCFTLQTSSPQKATTPQTSANTPQKSDFSPQKPPTTPQQQQTYPQAETPENVRFLVNLLKNWVSNDVDSSVPTIYYGARTHKQLQQVIKEFKRTSYCGEAKMTVLASREYSCIRDFDRKLWKTKNDMCRECIKTHSSRGDKPKKESNCKFYDNRAALHHGNLPPAFDLEELVAAGEEKASCPYYVARGLASSAHIVFCPYNYLIEPSIRSSMQIDLTNNIVVIDEAHNIEDICRDAASFVLTRENLTAAITELGKSAEYLYTTGNMISIVEDLLKTLKIWDDWFNNQLPLLNNQPVNNTEAVYSWDVANFVQTLNNHNIGPTQYPTFKHNVEIFCQWLREDPRKLVGITQATGSLVEGLDTVLGYMFREGGLYMDDFKPVLVRTVAYDAMSEAVSWRSSQFNQRVQKDEYCLRLLCMTPSVIFSGLSGARCVVLASGTLTPLVNLYSELGAQFPLKRVQKDEYCLRLLCMTPSVIFSGLSGARCVVLASGTLTPLVSLYSELGAQFPLKVSPGHVISSDRVWVGTLSTGPDGSTLDCKSSGTNQPGVQDGIGEAVLWVCQVTPHGVLCFMPSYQLMSKLVKRWKETGIWRKLEQQKHVFMESRNVRDHNDIMEDYYKYVETDRGAVLFAVFRGKVSEGMDFRDHQARAVITIGIPYPNTYDLAVKEKMAYNNKYEKKRNLLNSSEWLRVQAYRALNQAVGRCVRHRGDWGAVLMIDCRFNSPYYTQHLAKWLRDFLNNNHHTYESLVNSDNSLESFMQNMTIRDQEDI